MAARDEAKAIAKAIEEARYVRKIPEPGDWVHIEGQVAVPMDDDGKPDRKSACVLWPYPWRVLYVNKTTKEELKKISGVTTGSQRKLKVWKIPGRHALLVRYNKLFEDTTPGRLQWFRITIPLDKIPIIKVKDPVPPFKSSQIHPAIIDKIAPLEFYERIRKDFEMLMEKKLQVVCASEEEVAVKESERWILERKLSPFKHLDIVGIRYRMEDDEIKVLYEKLDREGWIYKLCKRRKRPSSEENLIDQKRDDARGAARAGEQGAKRRKRLHAPPTPKGAFFSLRF